MQREVTNILKNQVRTTRGNAFRFEEAVRQMANPRSSTTAFAKSLEEVIANRASNAKTLPDVVMLSVNAGNVNRSIEGILRTLRILGKISADLANALQKNAENKRTNTSRFKYVLRKVAEQAATQIEDSASNQNLFTGSLNALAVHPGVTMSDVRDILAKDSIDQTKLAIAIKTITANTYTSPAALKKLPKIVSNVQPMLTAKSVSNVQLMLPAKSMNNKKIVANTTNSPAISVSNVKKMITRIADNPRFSHILKNEIKTSPQISSLFRQALTQIADPTSSDQVFSNALKDIVRSPATNATTLPAAVISFMNAGKVERYIEGIKRNLEIPGKTSIDLADALQRIAKNPETTSTKFDYVLRKVAEQAATQIENKASTQHLFTGSLHALVVHPGVSVADLRRLLAKDSIDQTKLAIAIETIAAKSPAAVKKLQQARPQSKTSIKSVAKSVSNIQKIVANTTNSPAKSVSNVQKMMTSLADNPRFSHILKNEIKTSPQISSMFRQALTQIADHTSSDRVFSNALKDIIRSPATNATTLPAAVISFMNAGKVERYIEGIKRNLETPGKTSTDLADALQHIANNPETTSTKFDYVLRKVAEQAATQIENKASTQYLFTRSLHALAVHPGVSMGDLRGLLAKDSIDQSKLAIAIETIAGKSPVALQRLQQARPQSKTSINSVAKSVSNIQKIVANTTKKMIANKNKSVKQVVDIANTVLVDNLSATTDGLAELQNVVLANKYTNVEFKWQNTLPVPAKFRIVSASKAYTEFSVRSQEVTVASGENGIALAAGLQMNTSYNFYLQRQEKGEKENEWVRQTTNGSLDYKTVKTRPPPVVNSYTTTKEAILAWTRTHDTPYKVEIYLSDKARTARSNTFKVVETSDITLKNKEWRCAVTGLIPDKAHYCVLSTVESDASGNETAVDVANFEFECSPYVDLSVGTVGASFADLSWDSGDVGADEEDGQADFKLIYWRMEKKKWRWIGTLMGNTPDTTRNFRAKGLKPGTKYLVRLLRQNMTKGHTSQRQKSFTTQHADLSLSDVTSTKMRAAWAEVYPDAQYKTVFETPGKIASVSAGKSLQSVSKYLSADTTYTVSLFVKENGDDILLDRVSVTTDKNAIVSVEHAKNTTVDVQVQAFSSSSAAATYYIKDASDKVVSAEFIINDPNTAAAELTKQLQLRGMSPKSTYKFTLYRREHGKWVKQSNFNATTLNPTVATSVSTQAALVTWEKQYDGGDYEVDLRLRAGGDVVASADNNSVSLEDDEHKVVLSGLTKDTTYYGQLHVKEGGEMHKVTDFNLKTSVSAAFIVNKVYASYAEVAWEDNDVGKDEDDNEAEFMVEVTNKRSRKKAFDSGWLPDSVSSVTATGLTPGESHSAILFRRGVDGKAVRQTVTDIKAKTTTMSTANVTTSYMTVTWPSIYANAKYLLTYSKAGEEPVSVGDGETTATTLHLSDLKPNTEYLLELYVIENGVPLVLSAQPVGASSPLGASAETGAKNSVAVAVLLLVGALLLLLSFVLMKKRK